jgi:hypothetical protein
MKINWGTKLAFFTIVFMVFIVTLVTIIMKQNVPLVEDDYYEKGLKYQQEIDNSTNYDSLVVFKITEIENAEGIKEKVLQISHTKPEVINGAKISFYRPSNKDLDKTIDTDLFPNKMEVYTLNPLQTGKWKISLTWMEGEKKYTIEKDFDR